MKWQGRRQSSNIEDRRGSRGGSVGAIGGVGALVVVLIGAFFGVDLTPLLDGSAQAPSGQTTAPAELTPAERQAGEFVAVTLADTEEVWSQIFRDQLQQTYRPTTLVLFSGATQSACGGASAQTGPFYCPGDKKVYLDTAFFATMEQQLGAGGDFAAAYVVAHEVGHHVQDELGILGEANRVRQQSSEARSNEISVMIELQADCFSGVWARNAANQFGSIERGDVEEAMNAASRIGDDTLQREAGQRVRPETFTHGTSEQRQRWFWAGYNTGDIGNCNTFEARTL